MRKKERLGSGFRKVDLLTDMLLERVLRGADVVTQKICANWVNIVGQGLAGISYPIGVFFSGENKARGTLIIEVSNPGFALHIQSCGDIIVSRVNCYFGYEAIAKIRIQVRKIQVL